MVVKVGIYRDRRKQRPWIVRWYGYPDMTTGKPKRYSRAFVTQAEARKFKAEQVIAFHGGRPRDRAEETTLQQFLADFLRTKSHSVKPKTHRQYKQISARLIEYFGDDCLLRQVGPQGAHQFIAELRPQAKGLDKLSDWSCKTMLTYCRSIFNEAVAWELIARNPFSTVRTRKVSVPDWHYMNIDQYKALLKATPTLRWQTVYALAYTCGLRKAELLNLQWQDIDFEQGVLTVCNRRGTDTAPAFETKNCKDRLVPIPEHTRSILQQWQLQQGRKRIPYVALTVRQYGNMVNRWVAYHRQGRAWESDSMSNNMMREFPAAYQEGRYRAGWYAHAAYASQVCRQELGRQDTQSEGGPGAYGPCGSIYYDEVL